MIGIKLQPMLYKRLVEPTSHFVDLYEPASSKWPFDIPNGGHLTPEKDT